MNSAAGNLCQQKDDVFLQKENIREMHSQMCRVEGKVTHKSQSQAEENLHSNTAACEISPENGSLASMTSNKKLIKKSYPMLVQTPDRDNLYYLR